MNKDEGEIERIRENVSKQKFWNKDQEGEKKSNGSWKNFRTENSWEKGEKSKKQKMRERRRRSNWERKK